MARGRYYDDLPTVEVQQTFYDPPPLATLVRWRTEAPPEFRFTLKAWQVITHEAGSPTYRRLRRRAEGLEEAGSFRWNKVVLDAWEVTREAALALRAEVVLFQCPAKFVPSAANVANLRRFFSSIERGTLRFAWEPRGEWPWDLMASLCAELELIHAVDPFKSACATDTAYFRLHGREGYRYRHTGDDLRELLELCRAHSQCYVFFNNVSMYDDALSFWKLASGQHC